MGLIREYNPVEDAGLLHERLKRAGLEALSVEITAEGQPRVELVRPTKANLASLAQILLTHDAAAVKEVQDDIDDDKPVTRRELRELLEQLVEELRGARWPR